MISNKRINVHKIFTDTNPNGKVQNRYQREILQFLFGISMRIDTKEINSRTANGCKKETAHKCGHNDD